MKKPHATASHLSIPADRGVVSGQALHALTTHDAQVVSPVSGAGGSVRGHIPLDVPLFEQRTELPATS